MLAAIARSDGTRASVARELFATRLTDAPLGPAAIDRNGDITPANIAVYRIDPPGVRGDPLLPPDLEGASIYRIITPSPSCSATRSRTTASGSEVRRGAGLGEPSVADPAQERHERLQEGVLLGDCDEGVDVRHARVGDEPRVTDARGTHEASSERGRR